jgi:hypothetical protein
MGYSSWGQKLNVVDLPTQRLLSKSAYAGSYSFPQTKNPDIN